VEAILQEWRWQPTRRILVTAPSNTAADVLLCRLMAISPSEMLRLMAFNRFGSTGLSSLGTHPERHQPTGWWPYVCLKTDDAELSCMIDDNHVDLRVRVHEMT
jgi:hypothetical protein